MYCISLKDPNEILNVVYTSRTHSQLAQVVRELKKLPYKIKNSVIGSRDNYCIYSDNSELKGNQLTLACNKLRKNKQDKFCEYGNTANIEMTYQGNKKDLQIYDIEEIKEKSKSLRVCP